MASRLARRARGSAGALLVLLVAFVVLVHHGAPPAVAAGHPMTMAMPAAAAHTPAAPGGEGASPVPACCPGGSATCTADGIATNPLGAAPPAFPAAQIQPAASLTGALLSAHAPPRDRPPGSSAVLLI